MAKVRKRTWTSGGKEKTAWVADYFDQARKRHIKTFELRRDAEEWLAKAQLDVKHGKHTPERGSITIAEAAELWFASPDRKKLRPSSVRAYRSVVETHIIPRIGKQKVAKLTTPLIEDFKDQVISATTPKTAQRAVVALKSILDEAQRKGAVAQNVARPVRVRVEARGKIGIDQDVPSDDDVRTLIHAAERSWRPLFIVAALTGMRGGELRALTWDNIDFERKVIIVRQNADHYGNIGKPKTRSGLREIPMMPMVINTLREWQLSCPRQGQRDDFNTSEAKVRKIVELTEAHPQTRIAIHSKRERPGISARQIAKQVGVHHNTVIRVRAAMPLSFHSRLWLVFPGTTGKMLRPACIYRYINQLQQRIGMVQSDGSPKYSMHGFRHFFASWLIDQGYPPKRLQGIMGHSTLAITMDMYGHLFPHPEDDQERFVAAEKALFAVPLQQKPPRL